MSAQGCADHLTTHLLKRFAEPFAGALFAIADAKALKIYKSNYYNIQYMLSWIRVLVARRSGAGECFRVVANVVEKLLHLKSLLR